MVRGHRWRRPAAALAWLFGAPPHRVVVSVHAAHSAVNAVVNVSLVAAAVMVLDASAREEHIGRLLLFAFVPYVATAPVVAWVVPRLGLPPLRLVRQAFVARAVLTVVLAVVLTGPAVPAVFLLLLVGQRVHTVALYAAVGAGEPDGGARLHANARLQRGAVLGGALGALAGGALVVGAGPRLAVAVAAGVTALAARSVPRSLPRSTEGDHGGRASSSRGPAAVSSPHAGPADSSRRWERVVPGVVTAAARGAAGAITVGMAGAAASGAIRPVAAGALSAALGLGGLAGCIAGPVILARDRCVVVPVGVLLGVVGAAVAVLGGGAVTVLVPFALVVGLVGNLARQSRDVILQERHPDAVQRDVAAWDTAAQAAWVATVAMVTLSAAGLAGAAVSCLALMTAALAAVVFAATPMAAGLRAGVQPVSSV